MVQCEDFEQGKILHKRIADSIRQFREAEFESMQEFVDCESGTCAGAHISKPGQEFPQTTP